MNIAFVFPHIPYKFAKTPYPPLGIAYLSAVIKASCKFVSGVTFVDGQILGGELFWQEVNSLEAEVVLISATIRQLKGAKRVARIVKDNHPETRVILGGPGPSALAEQGLPFMQETAIDVAVKGEAEYTLPLLLKCVYLGGDFGDLPNLFINKRGEIIETRRHSAFPDVNALPWPDRSLFDEKAYFTRWQEAARMTSVHIIGSRGCPFNCSFCDRTVSGRKVRYRNPEDVAEEMLFLEQRYFPDDIFYFDDLFTLNKKRVVALCRVLQEKSLKTSWSAQGRVDLVDQEMLETMRTAGCTELMFGVESGSERILKQLVKGFTREKIIRAFDLCHRAGIKPGAYLIVGVPGETKQDIQDTISLIERIEPFLLNFSFLTPFPNTALHAATKHLVGEWDYEQWDDFDSTVYACDFEIDPREARDMISDQFVNAQEMFEWKGGGYG